MLTLVVAIILDTFFGDPVYAWHPVRLMGKFVSNLEKRLNRQLASNMQRVLSGAFSVIVTIAITGSAYYVLIFLFDNLLDKYSFVFKGILAYQLLATRCLYDEGKRIKDVLKGQDVVRAKAQIGYLVSRDTENLSLQQIYKAAVETLTENTTDAIVAPMFYYGLFGLVGMALYKAINTLDSMIGYKNERYFYYGKFAARLDDIVNFIPARIAAICIILLAMLFRDDYLASISCFFEHRKYHASPNAGCTEAALAGALGIALSGPTVYFGKRHAKPYIGYRQTPITQRHLAKVMHYVIGVAIISYLMTLLIIW